MNIFDVLMLTHFLSIYAELVSRNYKGDEYAPYYEWTVRNIDIFLPHFWYNAAFVGSAQSQCPECNNSKANNWNLTAATVVCLIFSLNEGYCFLGDCLFYLEYSR